MSNNAEQYTVKTPELPEKIYPVNYAGFWDFSLDGCYDASPLNEMDFPNAGEIAAEVSKRYNEFNALKEENERLKGTIGVECVKQLLEAREENAKLQKFKEYVHWRLDAMGIPSDPEPEKNAEHGCRIEGRLNYIELKFQPKKDENNL